jgi:hypothetical protein
MLEKFSEYFFDPLVFWTAPLVLVAVVAGLRQAQAWKRRRFSETAAGNGADGKPRTALSGGRNESKDGYEH